MAAITYCPGPWLGLVRGATIVLLEQRTREDVVMAVWDVLGTQPAPEAVLGCVVSGYGMDLASIPQFAVVSFHDKLHAILRGDVVLNCDGVGTSAELSGAGVTTWTERLLPAQELFDLVINDGRDGEGRWLPLAEGIVQLGGIRVGVDTAEPGAGDQTAANRSETARAETPVPVEPMSRHQELNVPEGIEVTGIYDPDALDEAATADTIAGGSDPGAADEEQEDPEDLEDTVIHTKARRANLPPPATVPLPGTTCLRARPRLRPPHRRNQFRHNSPPRHSSPRPASHPTPAQQPAPAGLIDSVPWLTPSASARARAAEPAAAEAARDLRPVEPVERLAGALEGDHDGQTLLRRDFTDSQKALILALAEPMLRRDGTGLSSIPSSSQAAARLGWPMIKFNRKLDNVCDKLDRVGVAGLRGGGGKLATNRRARLVEHAVTSHLVTAADLPLLETQRDLED